MTSYTIQHRSSSELHVSFRSTGAAAAAPLGGDGALSLFSAPVPINAYIDRLDQKYASFMASVRAKDPESRDAVESSCPAPASEMLATIAKRAKEVECCVYNFYRDMKGKGCDIDPINISKYKSAIINYDLIRDTINEQLQINTDKSQSRPLEIISATIDASSISIKAVLDQPSGDSISPAVPACAEDNNIVVNNDDFDESKILSSSLPEPLAIVLSKGAKKLVQLTEGSPFKENVLKTVTGIFKSVSWLSGLGASFSALLPEVGLGVLLGLSNLGVGLLGIGILTIIVPIGSYFIDSVWEYMKKPVALQSANVLLNDAKFP